MSALYLPQKCPLPCSPKATASHCLLGTGAMENHGIGLLIALGLQARSASERESQKNSPGSWVQIPALPLTSSAALGSSTISLSPFLHKYRQQMAPVSYFEDLSGHNVERTSCL
jgi:hypothetical protein